METTPEEVAPAEEPTEEGTETEAPAEDAPSDDRDPGVTEAHEAPASAMPEGYYDPDPTPDDGSAAVEAETEAEGAADA